MPKLKPLYVNGKYFPSIEKASRYLNIARSNLSALIKGKNRVFYRGAEIERAQEEMTAYKINTPKETKKTPVIVDGVVFESMKDAEEMYNWPVGALSKPLRLGKSFYKGHKIQLVFPSKKRPIQAQKMSCKVYNKTLDITYNSIMEAANHAKCDPWTMSKKMESSGGFIDANGNEYIRLTPMKTKNVYEDTGKTIKKIMPEHSRTVAPKPDMEFPIVDIPVEKKPTQNEVPQIVKDAINDKIITLLKEKGLYQDILDLLKYGGFTTVNFNTKEND